MKILISPDSFKGSLTSIQASEIIKKAILEVDDNIHVFTKPMADGGEGTLDAFLSSTSGKRVLVDCTGPLGNRISTSYVILPQDIAIIEFANIAGLIDIPKEKRNPEYTTSFGLGEVLLDALEKGCKTFIIGIGGSATNDCGLGMLLSLGMQAWDKNGYEVGTYGSDLSDVSKISCKNIDSRLENIDIKIAADVDNPLCGDNGATVIYGPQKGLKDEKVQCYDTAFYEFGSLVEREFEQTLMEKESSGAAGGVGFALQILNGEVFSGAKLIAEFLNLEKQIRNSDLIITGEGKSDKQTLFGKAPGYVADLSKKYNKNVLLISGSLEDDLDMLKQKFSGCFSIINKPSTIEVCLNNAEELLYQQTKQIISLIKSIS